MRSAIYLLDDHAYHDIYGPQQRQAIAQLLARNPHHYTRNDVAAEPALLTDVEVILSGWGMPVMDKEFLAAAPRLQAVFYGAGSIRRIATEPFWDRDIIITSSYAANAVPVTELALAHILFSLKGGWHFVFTARSERRWPERIAVPGNYGSTVGIVSLGMVGRGVAARLQHHDHRVIGFDPYVDPAQAKQLGVELCSLEQVFAAADVVTVHTPWLDETEGLITGELLASMKPGATFVNTSRGAVVRQDELLDVLARRPDLWAILDVTYPEPPAADSPLFALPNLIVTPHIAGSRNAECQRQGQIVVEQLGKYLRGEPLDWQITRERARIMA